MRAAGKGHTVVVAALLDAGADVHRADVFGETALHCAAGFGHSATVEVLLSAGARLDIRRTDGKTPVSAVSGTCCLRAGLCAPLRVRVVLRRCGPRE
jgi:ankyrin repeat protein